MGLFAPWFLAALAGVALPLYLPNSANSPASFHIRRLA